MLCVCCCLLLMDQILSQLVTRHRNIHAIQTVYNAVNKAIQQANTVFKALKSFCFGDKPSR